MKIYLLGASAVVQTGIPDNQSITLNGVYGGLLILQLGAHYGAWVYVLGHRPPVNTDREVNYSIASPNSEDISLFIELRQVRGSDASTDIGHYVVRNKRTVTESIIYRYIPVRLT